MVFEMNEPEQWPQVEQPVRPVEVGVVHDHDQREAEDDLPERRAAIEGQDVAKRQDQQAAEDLDALVDEYRSRGIHEVTRQGDRLADPRTNAKAVTTARF